MATPTSIEIVRTQAAELARALDTLRHAIQRYWDDHDAQPGATNPEWFADQLTQPSNVVGQVGEGDDFVFGPYVEGGVLPSNPFAGNNDVRLVEAWPAAPAGPEAWIYNHVSGEIRANVDGAGPDGHRFFNL